eukprot:135592_1
MFTLSDNKEKTKCLQKFIQFTMINNKMKLLVVTIISSVLYIANSYTIGVDLGASFSCVGVMINGKVEIIPNAAGNRVIPSVVSFTDQKTLIGDDIYEYGNPFVVNPNNTIYQTKRMIGRRFSDKEVQKNIKSWPFTVINKDGKPYVKVQYQQQETTFSPEEISGMVLNKVKQAAEAYLGTIVTNAVVTVPADFDDLQRGATKDAGALAGLNVLRIINEPTAAAIAHGIDKKYKDGYVLIFHLGGSTLQVSLLELDEGVFEILNTSSNSYIGGNNFDEILVDYFAKVFRRKHKINISNNERAKAKLRRELQKAKHQLSHTTQVRIQIESFVEGIDFNEILTRARFEELNMNLFTQTITSIEKVLENAGFSKNNITDIILSGGSTKIPKIQQLVKEFFNGKDALHGINPDEVAAYGASVQAGILDEWYRSEIQTRHTRHGGVVKLNEQSVDININNNYASITYSFEFENIDKIRDSEIQYEMSIDSGAYISHFIGEIDGEIYKGITKEKKKAAAEYKQACEDKKNAILVSQDHDANTFRLQTNIQPGSKAVLNVTVEQLLVMTFGQYELSLDISNIDNN